MVKKTDEWYEKKDSRGRRIIKDKDKPLKTRAAKFGEWVSNKYPELKFTSGDRASKGNHSEGGSLDISGIRKLKKKNRDDILRTAAKMDIRVGKEEKGKRGVQGWTGPHYHFSSKGKHDFVRGGTTGSASNKKLKRTKSEQKENVAFQNKMKKFREEGPVGEQFGPNKNNNSSIRQEKSKVTLSDKLKGLSQIDPEGSNKKENIEAVLENDPNKLVPQITKDTPRLAMIPNNENGKDLTEVEKRRRDRFLAVQGGTTPPNEVTRVVGIDDSQEELRILTEQVASPIRSRNQSNPRPINESQEVQERRTEESVQQATVQTAEKKAQGDSIIKSNPNQVKDLIKSMPELDPDLQRNVGNDIDLKNKGQHDKRSGPASQFTEALSFFLPQIIGGLIGGAMEGTEGAVGGIEASGQARDAFLKHQQTNRTLASKENQSDYKTFVDSEGSPVTKVGDKFFNLDKKQVPSKGITHATTFRQTRSLDQRNTEGVDRNDRFNKKYDLDKQKASQLTPKQVEGRANMTNVLASIDRISALKKGVDTGPFADKWGRLTEYFDKQPQGFTELKSETSDSLAKYVKALSGAQVSEMEAQRLGAIIPNTSDNDETFKKKLKIFKTIMEDNQAAFDQAIKSGQPLKAGQIVGLQEAEKEFLSKRGPAKKSKGVMTDKQRNRMKELQAKYPNRG